MKNPFLDWRGICTRMYRASRLDSALFREVKRDTAAAWQAVVAVALAGLCSGIGFGLAGFFKMAGSLSLLGLFIGMLGAFFLWLVWSFCAWLIGTKMLRGSGAKATFRELLRTMGFAVSPAVLGIFVFVPLIGGVILLVAILWVLVALLLALKQSLDVNPGRAAATWAAAGFAVAVLLIATVSITVTSERLFGGNWPFSSSFDNKLDSIVQPYRFSIAAWEFDNAPGSITRMFSSIGTNLGNAGITVEKYFSTGERSQPAQDTVEKILEDQIKQILAAENITGFPPVNLNWQFCPVC
jgi:hypothetical protein